MRRGDGARDRRAGPAAPSPRETANGGEGLRRRLAGLAAPFLELIYPPRCLICGAWGAEPLCDACVASIPPVAPPLCPRCGQTLTPGDAGPHCPHCSARRPAFDRARALGAYDGVLRRAIHRLKYRDRPQLAGPLGRALARYAGANARALGGSWDLVVPVPMAAARERVRGYNQAARIAGAFAAELGIPCSQTALRRAKAARPQVGLAGDDRRRNLAGAFAADPRAVDGKVILVIDDVSTTGSTLHECAAALKAAGAKAVYALTLAAG